LASGRSSRSVSPAGHERVSLDETRRQDALRAAIIALRAGTPWRNKRLEHQAKRLLTLAISLCPGGGVVVPSPASVCLVAQGMAQLSWNRSAGSLLAWERYTAELDTPFLPACPAHFANFLAESAESAEWALQYSQTRSRVCAINALSLVARPPSPSKVEDVHDTFFFASKFALFATVFYFFATPPYIFATHPSFFATK
jgi:hypothetical protein